MTYADILHAAEHVGLTIVGGFHPETGDGAPAGCQTLLMLGPKEPGFWQRITSSPEYVQPDPVDRWSERVITTLAHTLGATAIFPFGGPPYQPFVSWAMKTGRVWSSPVQLMVHDQMGLFLSFRGALAFSDRLDLPAPPAFSPCDTCTDQPCRTACPPKALTAQEYNLDRCHNWLNGEGKESCMTGGCLVRRSCPISRNYGRLQEQSAHHMRAFHKG